MTLESLPAHVAAEMRREAFAVADLLAQMKRLHAKHIELLERENVRLQGINAGLLTLLATGREHLSPAPPARWPRC